MARLDLQSLRVSGQQVGRCAGALLERIQINLFGQIPLRRLPDDPEVCVGVLRVIDKSGRALPRSPASASGQNPQKN